MNMKNTAHIVVRGLLNMENRIALTAVQRWMVMGMVDCVGKELSIGDKVVCADMKYADLLIGEIVGFTPKKARVSYKRSEYGEAYGVKGQKEQLKESYQIFKYEEVVRCKDCKHIMHSAIYKTYFCTHIYGLRNICISKDDFCSYGERREGE